MPIPPEIGADDIDGTETLNGVRRLQNGTMQRFRTSLFSVVQWAQAQRDMAADIGNAVAAYFQAHPTQFKGDRGATGAVGAVGASGPQGPAGADGKPKFYEVASASTNASGVGSVTFSSAFTSPPTVVGLVTFAGDVMAFPVVSSVAKTGCNVTAKVSRGTLLLTSGPFQTAGVATSVSVLAMGS